MKLELKHLCAYLPYGLEMLSEDKIHVLTVATFSYRLHDSMPILRPLSDLTKEIEFPSFKFVPLLRLCIPIEEMENEPNFYTIIRNVSNGKVEPKYIPHWVHEKLVKWHFDVFGLIPEGLAIDINTIDK